MTEWFTIRREAEGRLSITCRCCGRKSYNPNDVSNRYCGNCNCFHQLHAETCTRKDQE